MKRKLAITALAILAMLASGCVNTAILVDYTKPIETPTKTAAPLPTKTPDFIALPENDGEDDVVKPPLDAVDYQSYITYRDLRVYENDGETFMEATIVSEYEGTLVGVLDIHFYDKIGELARAHILSGDGQEVLYLPKGETRVYSCIPTDMSLTMADFYITTFDEPLVPLG